MAAVSTQIAVRLEAKELQILDAEVAAGRASTRSEAVRKGIAMMERQHAYQREAQTLKEYAKSGDSLYPDLKGFAPPIIWDFA